MTKTLQEASKFAIRVALQLAVLYNKHCHKCKLWAVSFWAPSPFNKEVFLLTLKTCATPFFSACESSAALPKQQWTEDTIVHWTKTSKCTWHQTSPSSRCPKSKSDHSFAMLQCSATNAVRSCRARVCCRELLLDVVPLVGGRGAADKMDFAWQGAKTTLPSGDWLGVSWLRGLWR